MVRTKPKPPTATHIFRAVWPVTDMSLTHNQLIAEALDDLPAVASRHHATIVGNAHAGIFDGRRIPGSGGAPQVVVIEAPAIEAAPRNYRQATPHQRKE